MKCPFCGSTKIKTHDFVGESKKYYVCKNCEKVIPPENYNQQ